MQGRRWKGARGGLALWEAGDLMALEKGRAGALGAGSVGLGSGYDEARSVRRPAGGAGGWNFSGRGREGEGQ